MSKKRISGIYKITNIKNNKVYIGSSINMHERKLDHLSALKRGTHGNICLQRAYNKYGIDSFCFEVIEIIHVEKSNSELLSREQFWLDTYMAYDDKYGYNILKIVEKPPMFGRKHTEQTKEIIRKHRANQTIIMTEETKKKIADSNRGRKMSNEFKQKCRENNIGKKHSDETKKKISLSNTGKKMSPESIEKLRLSNIGRPSKLKGTNISEETKAKISKANKGHIVSEETRKKLSISHKGKKLSEEHVAKIRKRMQTNHPNKGKSVSEETKKKISKNSTVKKMVRNVSTGMEFKSIQDAAKYYNISHIHIGCVCQGKRATSGGYIWEYVDSNIKYERKENKAKRCVENIDCKKTFESITLAGEFYGISISHISAVCRGKRKKAGGFMWRYVDI